MDRRNHCIDFLPSPDRAKNKISDLQSVLSYKYIWCLLRSSKSCNATTRLLNWCQLQHNLQHNQAADSKLVLYHPTPTSQQKAVGSVSISSETSFKKMGSLEGKKSSLLHVTSRNIAEFTYFFFLFQKTNSQTVPQAEHWQQTEHPITNTHWALCLIHCSFAAGDVMLRNTGPAAGRETFLEPQEKNNPWDVLTEFTEIHLNKINLLFPDYSTLLFFFLWHHISNSSMEYNPAVKTNLANQFVHQDAPGTFASIWTQSSFIFSHAKLEETFQSCSRQPRNLLVTELFSVVGT